jgi:hypothetical protein
MDDHKLVMISILKYKKKNMRKMQFFNKNILGKVLEFGRMHENKIFVFVFFKGQLI